MDRRQDVNMETRVAVLEVQVDNHATKLEQNQEVSNRLMERLDTHMTSSAVRDEMMQQNLTQITVAVTALSSNVAQTNETLKTISGLAEGSNVRWIKVDASVKTISKIIAGAILVISGLWAFYTFGIEHPESVPHIEVPITK